MTKSVMTLGIYEFPAPLGVTAGCFNKTIKIKIGDLNAKAILPILEWSGENPRVIAPTMSPDVKKYVENYAKSSSEDLRKEHFWGNVSGRPHYQSCLQYEHLIMEQWLIADVLA